MSNSDVRALGRYVVPGGVRHPRRALDEARTAEALGLGTVCIGERCDDANLYVKRAHVLGHAFGDSRDARSRLIRLPAAV